MLDPVNKIIRQPLGFSGDFEVRQALKEFPEHDFHLPPGQVYPQAEVGARAKSEMLIRAPRNIKAIRVLEDR